MQQHCFTVRATIILTEGLNYWSFINDWQLEEFITINSVLCHFNISDTDISIYNTYCAALNNLGSNSIKFSENVHFS